MLKALAENGILTKFFVYSFTLLVAMSFLVSLTMPVERAIGFFNFLSGLLGMLILTIYIEMVLFICTTGFYPEVQKWNNDTKKWEGQGYHSFNFVTLTGVVMIGVYLIPMIFRPLDFVLNFVRYIVGLFAYLFMLPSFSVFMRIYAMCHLHDISWGNRPSSSNGVEAMTHNRKRQEELRLEY